MPDDPTHESATTADPAASAVDRAYAGACSGDERAFAEWVGLVELPLRASLRSFAANVDVEAVLQECLLRMWKLAPVLTISGRHASLRYATRLLKNLAVSEARRRGREARLAEDPPDWQEGTVEPSPAPSPRLALLIRTCLNGLPRRPRQALMARIEYQALQPDRELAVNTDMKLNTFLQNIVRARKLMATCLEKHGVDLREVLP